MLDGTQHVGDGYLYTMQLDADAGTLKLLNTTGAAAAHPWLSVDVGHRVVYASGWSNPIAGQRTYSAYAIQDDFTPRLLNTVPSCGTKPIANQFIPQAGRHGIFYGVDFVNPCGDVWTVKESGAFDEKIETIVFEKGATLHGFANTPNLKYTYITDLGGNLVHTYSLDIGHGTLREIARTAPSETGAGPRHAVIHRSSKFMYVIDEEGLRVDQFSLDASTGVIALTNLSLAVTPFGLTPANASLYWGDEIVLSSDSKTLYASTRSRVSGKPGYIAGWALTPDGALDSSLNVNNGALFIVPTPASGGTANILDASPWSDASKNMLILTDQDSDFVALYKLGKEELIELDRVNITGTNCCAGSVWLD